jgi:antitoxin component YwqK of YwqJK toxin-antitoxin module
MNRLVPTTTIFLLLNVTTTFSQRLITARILDTDTKKPVNQAKVRIANSTTETVTNALGYFQLNVDTTDSLIIESKDYEASYIKIPDSDKFQINLTKTAPPDSHGETGTSFQYGNKNLKHLKDAKPDNAAPFYEIIKEDSVRMFFNERYRFIEKKCSKFIRYTKVDTEGNFNGYYEDITNERILVGKGHYVHGKKHGYFELYYPNGKIHCRGNYKNNSPMGQWEYFYENALPERTIEITETDTLVIRFVDKKGNVKVINGNGEFNGFVMGRNSINPNSIIAKGKIENGKPNGKWLSALYTNAIYCKEEFDHGKLIRGSFPNAKSGGNKDYHNKSYLNTFFLPNYLNSLENFTLEKCEDSTPYSPKMYSFDLQKLNSELREKIDRIISEDFSLGRSANYSIGDNYLTIQFSVNNDGRAENFRLMSGWGQQFFNTITTSIRMQTKFPASTKTMFFHLKLHFTGGVTYGYNFQFSKDSTFF